MKPVTMQWRLTVWNVLVVTGVLVLFSVGLLSLLRIQLLHRADDLLSEELREFVDEIDRCQDVASIPQELSLRFAVHSDIYFVARNLQGDTIFCSRYLQADDLPFPAAPERVRGREFTSIDLGREQYRMLATVVRDANATPLVVNVLRSRVPMEAEFREYVVAMLLSGIGAVSVTWAAAYLLAKRLLAPISLLTREADRISAEELNQRLPLTNPDDEFGRLTLTLNRLFDRIQQAMDRMKLFTANAAHELRSPIAIMRTEAEVALQSSQSPADWRRAVEVVVDESTRLGELVDKLLELSRHDAGLDAIKAQDSEEVPIHALLADVVATFQLPAQQKRVEIVLGDIPPWITPGDDIRLGRLFHNLLDNAVKYTPPGGTIQIVAEQRAEQLRIEVRDSGPGIPAEHLEAVFERFFRVDSARNREAGGSGLGLAICRAIAEAHHGAIRALNRLQGGTCIEVTLPGELASVEIDAH